MKALILVSNSSGNTKQASELLATELKQNNVLVRLVDITGNRQYFSSNDLEKAKNFMDRMIARGIEEPATCLYPY